jgi:preprotein translocase subunit SecD
MYQQKRPVSSRCRGRANFACATLAVLMLDVPADTAGFTFAQAGQVDRPTTPPAEVGAVKPRRVFLELRLAETVPVRGLAFEATVKNSEKKVYVHYQAVATHVDVVKASVVENGGRFEVALTLTPEAAAKLTSATSRHAGRPVAVILDGDVVSVLTVRSPIGGAIVVSADFTREEATRIAGGLQGW